MRHDDLRRGDVVSGAQAYHVGPACDAGTARITPVPYANVLSSSQASLVENADLASRNIVNLQHSPVGGAEREAICPLLKRLCQDIGFGYKIVANELINKRSGFVETRSLPLALLGSIYTLGLQLTHYYASYQRAPRAMWSECLALFNAISRNLARSPRTLVLKLIFLPAFSLSVCCIRPASAGLDERMMSAGISLPR